MQFSQSGYSSIKNKKKVEKIACANRMSMLYSNLVRSFSDKNGWIPEWPKGTDCKSAANCFGGSNPPPPIKFCSLNFGSAGGA